MRLVYVTVSMPFGSSEEFLICEARELLRQGHETLIVPRSPRRAIINNDAAGLVPHCLRRSLLSPSVVFGAVLELIRRPVSTGRILGLLFGSGSLSVRVKNALAFPKGLWLGRVARKWSAEHIHAHWGLTTATMAMIAGEMTGIPWSMTLHRGDIAVSNLLVAKTARASFVRYVSKSGLRLAAALGAAESLEKGRVIHMGADLPTQYPVGAANSSPFVVLCPAHLYPVKGHIYLIQGMSILRDRGVRCELHLAGEGRLREELEREVDVRGLRESISFLGHVPHDTILEWFRRGRINAVVLPSVDLGSNLHEGIPVALMEAMAYGIPVISTQTGGIPELLDDGGGIMVPPRDPWTLAAALERLIEDSSLCEQYGAAGRRRIEQDFAVCRTVAELVDCFVSAKNVLQTGPR